jgi:nicotinamide mononucleotide transporter
LASSLHWVNLSVVEVLGFITGGVCVWLLVKENIWNWPVGIANAIFFIVLFLQARLFADMALQVVYVVLGFLGWYWWLRGGRHQTKLDVTRTPLPQWIALAFITGASTWAMTVYLGSIRDSAPFLDALTTVLSLVAQYLQTRKYLESWLVWIAADVIYIGLYIFKGLDLTAVLYAIFLTMCIIGFAEWKRSLLRTLAGHERIGIRRTDVLELHT